MNEQRNVMRSLSAIVCALSVAGCGCDVKLGGVEQPPAPPTTPISGSRTRLTFSGNLGSLPGSISVRNNTSQRSSNERIDASAGPESCAQALYNIAKRLEIPATRDTSYSVTLKWPPNWTVTCFNTSKPTAKSWDGNGNEIPVPKDQIGG